MAFPKGKELVNIFLDGIHDYPEFQVQSNSNPLRLSFNGQSFMVFFKCISYAGNPYPKNTTRAQLPFREEFNTLNKDELFLFLGYDTENDLYVCWDPTKTRARLNQKSYVSFFCRKSLQDSVVEGEIKNGRLTNGDEYVLFKRSDTSSFFEMIGLHFPNIKKSETEVIETLPINATEPVEGFLDDISSDSGVQLLVDQLISQNRSKLDIVSECMNSYGSYFYRMRFIDWARVIDRYINYLAKK
jgi:hypothetical protein